MEPDKNMKIAVLIDAENISYKYTKLILDEASSFGTVICRRIYGDWSSAGLSTWKTSIMDYSINAIQQFHNTSGKNSSDSALIIDAMDLLHEGKYQCVCIASSDSDFTRLASRLRESEIYVVGMGEQKTPTSFRSACDKFLYLDILFSKEAPNTAQPEPQQNTGSKTTVQPVEPTDSGLNKDYVISIINEIISAESNDDGWCFMSKLGNKIATRIPDFDVRNFGHEKLSKFIQSISIYETKKESSPTNPALKVMYVRKK